MIRRRRIAIAAVALGLMAAMAGRAEAGYLNHSIHSQYFTPDLNTLFDDEGTATVSPTATFIAHENVGTVVPFLQAKFTDTNLTITSVFPNGTQFFFNGAFNGFSFTDTGGNLGVTSFSVDAATNVAGFTASDVTLSQGRLLVNLAGLTIPTTGVISLDFLPASVPEPSSLALCGVGGLMGLAAVRRRVAGKAK